MWKQVNVEPERLNGLKFRVFQFNKKIGPEKTSAPKLLDFYLEKAGIPKLSDEELNEKLGVISN
jgi:hypothetical protein